MESEAWNLKREEKLRAVKYLCYERDDHRYAPNENGEYIEIKMCSGPLQVHHLTYIRLGNEDLSDLRVLCEWHHKQEHERWKLERQRRWAREEEKIHWRFW